MTIDSLFTYVRGTRDNAFSDEVLIQWTNEVEATIQTDVMLLDVANVKEHTEKTESVIADAAHTKLYWLYLYAMICYANGEFKKYQDYCNGFNQALKEYAAWYADRYDPASGRAETAGYYISAYSLAVKHGFSGTEDEWIAAVDAARTSAESSAAAAANALAGAEAAKTAAAASETAAAKSAADASSASSGVSQYVSAAQSAAADAATAKTEAAASQSAAASSATAAAASQTAAKTSETNAKASETAAESAQTNASASASTASKGATDAQSAQTAAESARDAAVTAKTAAEAARDAASSSKTAAATSESNAASSATAAADSEAAAATSETNAASSATSAANSAAQAVQIVGGDFATKEQAQDYATTAKSDAISAAASDATTKANTAEANAKAASRPVTWTPTATDVGADAAGSADAALASAKSYADTKDAGKTDKKVPAAAGNLAALDASGNLADSGKVPAEFAGASHTHTKDQITDFPATVTPTAHKSTHASGGSDPLTPADIGAASNPNLLDNWDFRNPVNTSALTSFSGHRGAIDRWTLQQVTASSLVINNGYITLTGTNNDGLEQRLPPSALTPGNTYTISLKKYDGSIFSASFTCPSASENSITTVTIDATWEIIILYGGGLWHVFAPITYAGTSHSIDIVAVKLELGTVSTLANDPPASYGEQLARCKAAPVSIGGSGGLAAISTGSYTGTGTYGSSNPNTLTFPFPPKRISIRGEGVYIGEMLINGTTVYGYSNTGGSNDGLSCSISGNTVSWYGIGSSISQLNISGSKYLYVVEG